MPPMDREKLTPDEVLSAFRDTLKSGYVGQNPEYICRTDADVAAEEVVILDETDLEMDLRFDQIEIAMLIGEVFARLCRLLKAREIPFSFSQQLISDGIRFLRKREEAQVFKPQTIGRLQEFFLSRLRERGCLNEEKQEMQAV